MPLPQPTTHDPTRPPVSLPGDHYHRPHLCGVDDRERQPVRDVECPACIGPGGIGFGCTVCHGQRRVSPVALIEWRIEWRLERMDEAGGWERSSTQPHLWRLWSGPRPNNVASVPTCPGITTAELASRLAPVWQHVEAGIATMAAERVEVDDSHPGRRDYLSNGREYGGQWAEGPTVTPPDPWWYPIGMAGSRSQSQELARRQAADPCVLSSGRRVERAYLLESRG